MRVASFLPSFLPSSPSSFFCCRLTNSLEPDCFLMRLLWTEPFPLLLLPLVFTDDVGDGVERSFFRLGTPLREESRDQGDAEMGGGRGRSPTVFKVFFLGASHSQTDPRKSQRTPCLRPQLSTSNKFDVVVSHVYQYLDTVFKHATHCYMHYCSQWPRGYIAVNERQTHHIHCLRPRGRLLTGLVWEGERDFVGGGAAADDGGVERAMSERGREGAAPLCFHWNGRRADEWRALCSLAHVRKEGRRIEVGRPPRFLDNLGFGRAFRGTAPSVPT